MFCTCLILCTKPHQKVKKLNILFWLSCLFWQYKWKACWFLVLFFIMLQVYGVMYTVVWLGCCCGWFLLRQSSSSFFLTMLYFDWLLPLLSAAACFMVWSVIALKVKPCITVSVWNFPWNFKTKTNTVEDESWQAFHH